LERQHKIGLGAFAALLGVAFVTMRSEPPEASAKER
jgi:hypothetical protein